MAETLNLQKTYKEKIKPELSKEFGGLNPHATIQLDKIVVNTGIGKIANVRKAKSTGVQTDEEMMQDVVDGLSLIAGQKPHLIYARKSIAGFKLREGMPVGLRVTLRGKKMYDFLSRFVDIALPRTRDFRGIPLKAVDKGGNLTVGIKESSIFPEVPLSNFNWGFEITFVTSVNDREQAIELFKKLGIPFKKEE
jgi:large subunit ribosomal protein L5